MSDTWTKIGDVDVDAGLIMVGDPCYTQGEDASSRVETWEHFLRLMYAGEGSNPNVYKPFGHKGAAVVVNTLHGDGTYPVYAKFKPGGISQIMIDFDWSDDSDPDDE